MTETPPQSQPAPVAPKPKKKAKKTSRKNQGKPR
jgi:hypothetical protein